MFMKLKSSMLVFLSSSLFALVAQAYNPPIGIPDPSDRWGTINPIDDPAPSRPTNWSQEVPGFYYIDPGHPAATDTNTYGSENEPRITVPNGASIQPGAYLELTGVFDTPVNFSNFNCTEAAPCWVVGKKNSPPNLRAAKNRINFSNYLLIDNLTSIGGTGDAFIINKSGHHIIIRNSVVQDRVHGGGGEAAIGIGAPDHGEKMHDIISYNNKIIRVGDVTVTEDQDFHGHAVNTWGRYYADGTELHHVWVLDNYCEQASGDCTQVTGGLKENSHLALHHIYIGRNESLNNRQNNTGVKEASDVIVSQNLCRGGFTSGGNNGGCFGHQYTKDWVWFIFNEVAGSQYGFRNSAHQPPKDELGEKLPESAYDRKVFVIGNLFYDIRNNPNTFPQFSADAGNRDDGFKDGIGVAWPNSNATTLYVIDNTIYKAWTCLGGARTLDHLYLHGNICADKLEGLDSQLAFGHVSYSGTQVDFDYMYFLDDVENTYNAGFPEADGTFNSLKSFQLMSVPQCTHCIEEIGAVTDVFVNPTLNPDTRNFALIEGSSPVSANTRHRVYDMFFQRYGIDIYVDFNGNPRHPTNPSMGAFEHTGNIVLPDPPRPPENFSVIKVIEN